MGEHGDRSSGVPRETPGGVSRGTSRRRAANRPQAVDPDEALRKLEEVLSQLEISERGEAILEHARDVWRSADRLGLVSERTLPRVIMRHSVDSLGFALARRPMPHERWVDVGSGAGFPGLVLALAFPETEFLLVESQRRRVGFLELQVLDRNATNARVALCRAQDLTMEQLAGGFDVVTSRAFSSREASGADETAFALLATLGRPGSEIIVAAGEQAPTPRGVREVRVTPLSVDSPGRYLMMQVSSDGM